MRNLHDTLYGYWRLVDDGLADTDIVGDDRMMLNIILLSAVTLLADFGATPREDVIRQSVPFEWRGTVGAVRAAEVIRGV